jgi:hypothetical protein
VIEQCGADKIKSAELFTLQNRSENILPEAGAIIPVLTYLLVALAYLVFMAFQLYWLFDLSSFPVFWLLYAFNFFVLFSFLVSVFANPDP